MSVTYTSVVYMTQVCQPDVSADLDQCQLANMLREQ